MIKIVGFQHKEGSFKDYNGQNVSYNNVILFYLSDCSSNVIGCSVGELKIGFEKVQGITGMPYEQLPELLNKNVQLNYIPVGKYQQLVSISIIPEPEKVSK